MTIASSADDGGGSGASGGGSGGAGGGSGGSGGRGDADGGSGATDLASGDLDPVGATDSSGRRGVPVTFAAAIVLLVTAGLLLRRMQMELQKRPSNR